MVWTLLSFLNMFIILFVFCSGVFFIGALCTYGAYALLRDVGLYEKVLEWMPLC